LMFVSTIGEATNDAQARHQATCPVTKMIQKRVVLRSIT